MIMTVSLSLAALFRSRTILFEVEQRALQQLPCPHPRLSSCSCRAKYARCRQNILFKNILSPTCAAILYWLIGYTIAVNRPAKSNVLSIY